MTRSSIITVGLLAVTLAGGGASAQKKPESKPSEAPCVCPEEAPAPPLRESAFADCRDGRDNDGDGFVDCADQDCGIYAMCVSVSPAAAETAPAAAPAPEAETGRSYTTMNELKRDLRARAITGRDFLRWQRVIRLRRAAELDHAKADLNAGLIDRAEYRARVAEIKAKYEG